MIVCGFLQCDAIVNSISLGNYQEGNIAKAIYIIGGSAYEQECCSKLQGLSVDQIGYTSGSYIGCKGIYHIPFLSSDKTLAVSDYGLLLYNVIMRHYCMY